MPCLPWMNPQMLGAATPYLRDDGVQAVGPPGVVHWVGVQDAPGGKRPGQEARGGRVCPPLPATHQGPRPKLGMVAGVMMPLTSCWMILEERGQVTTHGARPVPAPEMTLQG